MYLWGVTQGVGGCRRLFSGLLTLVLLRCVVVVDLLADPLALAQVAGEVLLLLLVVVAEELLPVVGVHVLLLLDDLPLGLLLRGRRHSSEPHTRLIHTEEHTR